MLLTVFLRSAVLIDLLRLHIPFKAEFLMTTSDLNSLAGVSYIDLDECMKRGIKMSGRCVEFEIDGDLTVTGLNHPFEQLPSHYTGLAFKIYQGASLSNAHVQIKCSPAKLMQGHNVFGSTDIELGSFEMLYFLQQSNLEFAEMLDFKATTVQEIHCTYSAKLQNDFVCRQAIAQLKNVSDGQMKPSVNSFDTTVMWNKGSRHLSRVAYLKGPELAKQLAELKTKLRREPTERHQRLLNVMSDHRLTEFAENLLRFEGRAKDRFFERMGIPRNLFELIEYQKKFELDGDCLVTHIWNVMFEPLINVLKGQSMNIYDDESVYAKLKSEHFTVTKSGNTSYAKADRAFGFYRRLMSEGYQAVQQTFSVKKSFYNNLNKLLEAGISKSQLQQLSGGSNSNVVPLMKMINFDFKQQRPSWYVEPTPHYLMDQREQPQLRLVS